LGVDAVAADARRRRVSSQIRLGSGGEDGPRLGHVVGDDGQMVVKGEIDDFDVDAGLSSLDVMFASQP